MKCRPFLAWGLARFAVIGLLIGSLLGLVEALIVVSIDHVPLSPGDGFYLGLVFGMLGLLGGLGLGLLRGVRRQDAGLTRSEPYALAWLTANKDSRFFLFLHYMDPHASYFAHPYDGTSISERTTPHPDPAQLSRIRQYYDGEVAYLDTHLGALFDALKEWGLYDDMLIVFTSDHGEEFYDHGGWWHSETLYTVRRLRTALEQALAYAQANAVTGQSGELNAATRERLQLLGY